MHGDWSFRARLGTICGLVLVAASGCTVEESPGEPPPAGDPELAELQAILRDGDLSRLGAAAQGVTRPEALARPQVALIDARVIDAGPGEGGGPIDGGGPAPPGQRRPLGEWRFDDCSSFRTNLLDSSFNGNTAFRAVAVQCAEGRSFQGVAIAAKEDIVYVPDQPQFTFEQGVTVAGFFKPTTTGGTRTLIRKRDKGTSSFALVLNGNKYQFVVGFPGGGAASVTAPTKAKLNTFQHVAGTYDGQTVKLYVDGALVASLGIANGIVAGPGPLLLGNDGSERRFDGTMDSVIFDATALSAADIQELLCVHGESFATLTPSQSPPVSPGASTTFDLAITNKDPATCAPLRFAVQPQAFNLTIDPPAGSFVELPPIAPGTTGHLTITATVDDGAEAGEFGQVSVLVQSLTPGVSFFQFLSSFVEVGEPTGCHVSRTRELMITNPSVVDDPRAQGSGPWSFKTLMENLAPTAADAPDLVEQMLQSFLTPQVVNGFTMDVRPGMQSLILDQWPRTADGKLDLAAAPLRLQAIVNRFDLRDLDAGNGGEGRFVFAFESFGFPLQATLIFEYKLPAATEADVAAWASDFHALGAIPFGADYNAALQAITDRFSGRDARPGTPNGSALNVVRTNEIDFSSNGIWELREFRLSASDGMLRPSTVELTPDRSFNFSSELASFVNDNEPAILIEKHGVPLDLGGAPFRAASIFNDLGTWGATGITSNEARHKLALNTCNGCHSLAETGTFFLHINPRFGAGGEAQLSGFLRGITVADPFSGEVRTLNDLRRRAVDMEALVCAPATAKPGFAPGVSLRKGISRVH